MRIEEKDIFDRIMELRAFQVFNPVYKKYKEGILYLFFGGLTFFLAVFVYMLLNDFCGINPLIANIVSWTCGVTFSFFTTRKWVFRSCIIGLNEIIKQLIEFFGARFATLLLQECLIYIFVTRCGVNSMVVKIVTEFINIVLNYLVSKFIIFKRR